VLDKSDPFAMVHVLPALNCDWATGKLVTSKKTIKKGGTVFGKTEVVNNTLTPNWSGGNCLFNGEMPEEGGCLLIEVWDKNLVGSDDFLGEVVMQCGELQLLLAGMAGAPTPTPMERALVRKSGKDGTKWKKFVGTDAKITVVLKSNEAHSRNQLAGGEEDAEKEQTTPAGCNGEGARGGEELQRRLEQQQKDLAAQQKLVKQHESELRLQLLQIRQLKQAGSKMKEEKAELQQLLATAEANRGWNVCCFGGGGGGGGGGSGGGGGGVKGAKTKGKKAKKGKKEKNEDASSENPMFNGGKDDGSSKGSKDDGSSKGSKDWGSSKSSKGGGSSKSSGSSKAGDRRKSSTGAVSIDLYNAHRRGSALGAALSLPDSPDGQEQEEVADGSQSTGGAPEKGETDSDNTAGSLVDDDNGKGKGSADGGEEGSLVFATAEQLKKGAIVFVNRDGEFQEAEVTGPSKKKKNWAVKLNGAGKLLSKPLDQIKVKSLVSGEQANDQLGKAIAKAQQQKRDAAGLLLKNKKGKGKKGKKRLSLPDARRASINRTRPVFGVDESMEREVAISEQPIDTMDMLSAMQ
jgi:hypothetical protein